MPIATRSRITLTCNPQKEGDTLVFAYTLANGTGADAYVSDAGMHIDPASNAVSADPDSVTIWLGPDSYAHVLKGVAALPTDRRVIGRVMPLMVRLAPGESIERRLVLKLPLGEQSPYFGIGNLRDFRLTAIDGMRLAIDVLPVEATAALPAPFKPTQVAYAPQYWDIGVRGTLPLLQRLECSVQARGLHLMERLAPYPRPER